MRGVTFTRGLPRSGTLGEMVPLAAFREVADALKVKPWESLLISERVVIGYDDGRQVVILHDPSFGPAWEVPYGDFEKMMEVSKELSITGYLVIRPANAAEAPARRTPASPYRPRTPNERAAEHFVYGYALGSVGQEADAEEHLQAGLAIPGIGKGYQHLLLLELAVHERARGRTEDAIATAQKAVELVPEHFRPWQFLAQAYRDSSAADSAQKASAAADKARTLCSDSRALNVVAEVLGRDFFIVGCDPLRLLGGPTH